MIWYDLHMYIHMYPSTNIQGAIPIARAQLHQAHTAASTPSQRALLLNSSSSHPGLALRLGVSLALLAWAFVDLVLLPPAGGEGGLRMLARDPAFKVGRSVGRGCGCVGD